MWINISTKNDLLTEIWSKALESMTHIPILHDCDTQAKELPATDTSGYATETTCGDVCLFERYWRNLLYSAWAIWALLDG